MSAEVLEDAGSAADVGVACSAIPRPLAWIASFAHSALWPGAAAGAVYLVATAAVTLAAGRAGDAASGAFVIQHLSYALWFASLPIATAILVRGLARDVRDLSPVLGSGNDPDASLYREALAVAPRAVWFGLGVGVLTTVWTVWLLLALGPSAHLGFVFVALRETAVELPLFAVLGWALGAAWRLSRLVEQRARPDLLDLDAFAALARNGTRLAAVWLVLVAISLPGAIVLAAAPLDSVRNPLIFLLVLAALAVVALFIPCRGAHRVLRSAKRSELDAVRDQIAEARRTRDDVRLPGLLAWEARIAGISEWPIDAAALGRTGLFVLLPVASWVAAALVERLIDASLG